MNRFKILLINALVLLLSFPAIAAQSTKDVIATDKMKMETMVDILGKDVKVPASQSEYIVGHGDILGIQVYGEGSMAVSAPGPGRGGEDGDGLRGAATGVQVRIDGKISLKHLGDVQAVGMNLTQLADYLKVLYATVYEDPIVTVVLTQSNSQRYTVMGKVMRPGIYYLDYPINVVQVIARCGGFTEWANSSLTVVREGEDQEKGLFSGNTLNFDYDQFLKGKDLEKNVLILPDDIIIVH